eukprot:TRINITY_DN6728_c0_g1_i1.p1 TRINITY_DN6728_c0_g1~~TRINITY_DN6728_c0_g1_i1.p1  ORF type:complete len:241 (+),score=55.08 TRINITY_DN6728_c0_g1_i1:2-724(+)
MCIRDSYNTLMLKQRNRNYIFGLFHWCSCGICRNGNDFNTSCTESQRVVQEKAASDISFEKLLRLLEGADVLIPETIFFHRNVPAALIKFEERKRRIKVVDRAIAAGMIEVFVNKTKQREQTLIEIEDNTKVAAVVHYRNANETAELTDTKFINLMMLRRNNNEWKKISMIQRYVRNQFYRKVHVFFPTAEAELKEYYRIQNKVGNQFHEQMKEICEAISSHLMTVYCLCLLYTSDAADE